jgi:hypothetical protein
MTPTLAAVLPLKVSGRHYAENLERLDLLFSSLVHFADPELLDELIVVARSDEASVVERHLAHWPDLPLRIAWEEDHFPAFRRYTRAWQVRPWQRQQIIKLNAPALTSAAYVLTLDPDVVARRPLRQELLVPGGRALLEPEARAVHQRWWLDSADLLDVDPQLDRRGMNVTPAVLSTAVLTRLQRRLEDRGRRPWMDVLLTSYCDWTEYSLYLLAAESAGLVERHHIWADAAEAPAHLQVHPDVSIWDAAASGRANLERLFTADDSGLFAVVQSNSSQPASGVAAVASDHFPVRRTPAGPSLSAPRRSKLAERANTASRLAATRLYRLRRRWRRYRRGVSPVRANATLRYGDKAQVVGSPQDAPPSMR